MEVCGNFQNDLYLAYDIIVGADCSGTFLNSISMSKFFVWASLK